MRKPPPTLLPFRRPQPEPIGLAIGHITMHGETCTVISRTWKPEDIERCRLCEGHECGAVLNRGNNCLVWVRGYVDYADAPLYQIGAPAGQAPRPAAEDDAFRRLVIRLHDAS